MLTRQPFQGEMQEGCDDAQEEEERWNPPRALFQNSPLLGLPIEIGSLLGETFLLAVARQIGGQFPGQVRGVAPVGSLWSLPVCLGTRGLIASHLDCNLLYIRHPGSPKRQPGPPRMDRSTGRPATGAQALSGTLGRLATAGDGPFRLLQ